MRKIRKRSNGEKSLASLAAAGVLLLPVAISAQTAPFISTAQPGRDSACSASSTCSVVREIDDPSTGRQWLLMRDRAHPAGPGVLIAKESVAESGRLEGEIARQHPVIHAGDRLTVEQWSEKIDFWLEGVALAPAASGASLRVRLVITGKVIPAVALGPGRVRRVQDKEFWP